MLVRRLKSALQVKDSISVRKLKSALQLLMIFRRKENPGGMK